MSCTVRTSLMVIGGLLLVACDSPVPMGTSLFPLDQGREWRYRETTRTLAEARSTERVVLNVGLAALNPNDDTRYMVRRWSHGVDYYLTEDASGVYRKGLRTFVETEPREDSERRFVMKAPLKLNSNWTQDTHPYMLWRADQPDYDYKRVYTVQMTYTVMDKAATVTVPGGTFENVVLLEGESSLEVYTDPLSGVASVPITTREWYAPGVGLVKAERIEEVETATVKGGTWSMELLSYR